MSAFNSIIDAVKNNDYSQKVNLLEYLLHYINKSPRLSREDSDMLRTFANEQAAVLPDEIEAGTTYKEKDAVCDYAERILALVTMLYASKDDIPQNELDGLKALSALIDETRPIEATAKSIFEGDKIYSGYIDRLISFTRAAPDEYQKGKFYVSLIQNRDNLSRLDEESKSKITAYICEELERYLLVERPGRDLLSAWEMAVDLVKDFHNDKSAGILNATLSAGHSNITYYALESLISLEADFPAECIKGLAEDLEYANLTYLLLNKHGMTHLYPAEFASNEYLAKSDLVHWLIYPTELGKAPDEIEYIGKVKKLFSNEEYHVFKYRSDSSNLDDALRGKWLIGWSSDNGGTFSNFDLYGEYEKDTVEKTLKNIKKRLIK